jgi:hypothetical protein
VAQDVSGRTETVFLHHGVLPDGPGGDMLFEVSYLEDINQDNGGAR